MILRILPTLIAAAVLSAQPYDLVIRNALILDGTGAQGQPGDLAVEGGTIARIEGPGTISAERARTVIEAEGMALAPGFIDAHCHDDLICLREPDRIEKAMQGVTTLVVGNCSFSLYPRVPASTAPLRRHFSALLGTIHDEETFDDLIAYRARLEGFLDGTVRR